MIGREERRKANFGGKAFPNVLTPSVPDLQGQHANNFPNVLPPSVPDLQGQHANKHICIHICLYAYFPLLLFMFFINFIFFFGTKKKRKTL